MKRKDVYSGLLTLGDNKKLKFSIFQDEPSSQQEFGDESSQQLDDSSQLFDDNFSPNSSIIEDAIWDGKTYYLRHFDYVIETVLDTHAHLILEYEKEMLSCYKEKLPQSCKKLFIRMYNRKGPWFVKSEMKQKYIRDFENDDINLLINQLVELQFVKIYGSNGTQFEIDRESLVSLFHLLNVQQCNNIADKYWKHLNKQQRPTKKIDIINQLIEYNKNKDIANQNEKKKQSNDTRKQSKISNFFKPISPITSTKESLTDEEHYKNLAKNVLQQFGSDDVFIRINEPYLELFRLLNRIFTVIHTSAENSHNSTTLMVLTDTVKKIRFPNVQLSTLQERQKFSFFASRQDYDEYEVALQMQQQFFQLVEEEQDYERAVNECLEPAALQLAHQSTKHKQRINDGFDHYFLLRYTAGWIYARIVDSAVRILLETKLKRYDQAIQYLYSLLDSPFRIGSRGKWYERLALDYQQHLKQKHNAYITCMRALTTEAEILRLADRYTLEKRLSRLEGSKRLQLSKTNCDMQSTQKYKYTLINELKPMKEVHIHSKRYNQKTTNRSKKSLFYSYDGKTPIHVEKLALQYYALTQGFEGLHCEGSLCATLYGLLCWDIIYDSTAAPYAFQSKYQDAPLDLFTDAFFVTRKALFEERFRQMTESKDGSFMTDLIRKVVTENEGVQNKFIRWNCNVSSSQEDIDEQSQDSQKSGVITRGEGIRSDNVEWLCELVTCVGGKTLSMVCRMFAEDYHFYRSGMPDLLLWNAAQSKILVFLQIITD